MVYANPKISLYQIPENSTEDVIFKSYKDGKEISSLTSGEMVNFSEKLWNEHFSKGGDKPIFMSVDLETPLAFATFLANNSHHKKVFIPGTFNMSKILKSVKTQESEFLVCDKEFFELVPPKNKVDEYRDLTNSIEKIIVSSENG